jgi:transposase-like protein
MKPCPHCQSEERQVKAGFNRGGSQRYLCRGCRRTYTPEPKPLGHDKAVRRKALEYYIGYFSSRRIAEMLGVSPQSVFNWVNAAIAQVHPGLDVLMGHVRGRRMLETQERRWEREVKRALKACNSDGSALDRDIGITDDGLVLADFLTKNAVEPQ